MRDTVGSVGAKGQVTIPQEIRKELGIQPGDKVWISIEDGGVVLRRADLSVLSGYGSIRTHKPPLSDDEMDEIIAAEAAEDALRDLSPKD